MRCLLILISCLIISSIAIFFIISNLSKFKKIAQFSGQIVVVEETSLSLRLVNSQKVEKFNFKTPIIIYKISEINIKEGSFIKTPTSKEDLRVGLYVIASTPQVNILQTILNVALNRKEINSIEIMPFPPINK